MAVGENENLLEMRDITKTFPGVVALDNVTFTVHPGEVHCLVGENGAGKSTLIKILAGAYRADRGEIYLDGRLVNIDNPHESQELGISFIFQELNVVNQLTVADNITLGREKTRFGFTDRRYDTELAATHLRNLGVDLDPRAVVKNLSVAQKQMVEIAKALAIDASIIVMDEPSAPLTERELEKLFEIIQTLKKRGVTIIYISHRLQEIFDIGDRVTVLRDGRKIATLNVADTNRQELVRLMVGRDVKVSFSGRKRQFGKEILVLKNVSRRDVLHDISFSAREGEILGVAGLVGAGRTELARLIFGADRPDSGEIYFDGKRVDIRNPADAIYYGIGLVPEERRTQGIVGVLTVRDNISMSASGLISRFLWINRRKDREIAEYYCRQLDVRTPSVEQKVRYLSGGNQQKVVVAKWLCTNSRLLLLDEPTRGIDVGAKSEMFALMDLLAEQGTTIITFSSELEEILAMSDNIIVMHEGRITGRLSHAEATQEKIMHYATGGE